MNGARLAAIKLASLNVADRAWIMQSLSASEREQIAPVISAVLRLRKHEVEEIVQENDKLFQAKKRSKTPEIKASDLHVIKAASISQIGQVLDELDLVCLALLLNSQDWPWLTIYLNWKGPEAKLSLAEVLKQTKGRVGTKLLELTIAKVAQKLRPESALPEDKSRFEALLVDGHSIVARPADSTMGRQARNGASE